MKHKLLLGALGAGLVTAGLYWYGLKHPRRRRYAPAGWLRQVPCLFVPGYAGSRLSFGPMLNRYVRWGWGQKAAVVEVDRDGGVHVKGDPRVPGALIQVLFTDHTAPVDAQRDWLWAVLHTLKAVYGLERVNCVAHSMGAVVLMDYLSHFDQAQATAAVNRVVTLGAPFNDTDPTKTTKKIEDHALTASGPREWTETFRHFYTHKSFLPQNMAFLNVVGDLKDGSDGAVAVNSAKAMRFLVPNPAKYHELVVTGHLAGHSRLHENREVDLAIYRFLFKPAGTRG